MSVTIRRKSKWTVICIVESTGQMIADHVLAADAWDAFAAVADLRPGPWDDLTLVAALPGHSKAYAPADEGNKVCAANDYPTTS